MQMEVFLVLSHMLQVEIISIKMSDYCKNCEYDVKIKNGKNACPFNYLYWNFFLKIKKNWKKIQDCGQHFQILKICQKKEKIRFENDSKEFMKTI